MPRQGIIPPEYYYLFSFKVPVIDSCYTSEKAVDLARATLDAPRTHDVGLDDRFFKNLHVTPDGQLRVISDVEFKNALNCSLEGAMFKPAYTLPVGIKRDEVSSLNPDPYDTRALNAIVLFPSEGLWGFITWNPMHLTPYHHISSILGQVCQIMGYNKRSASAVGLDEVGANGVVVMNLQL